jgi:hypothetical protein
MYPPFRLPNWWSVEIERSKWPASGRRDRQVDKTIRLGFDSNNLTPLALYPSKDQMKFCGFFTPYKLCVLFVSDRSFRYTWYDEEDEEIVPISESRCDYRFSRWSMWRVLSSALYTPLEFSGVSEQRASSWLQGSKNKPSMQEKQSLWLTLQSWTWRQHVSPKSSWLLPDYAA